MTCPSCGQSNSADRSFCLACGEPLTTAAAPRAITGNVDVQQVELAYIPSALHAPTAWTIGKGVFIGLLLWSAFNAVIAALVFLVLLNL